MSDIDLFIDRVVRDMRRRLALLGDCGDRRAVEDSISLLTDYRVSGMDEAGFERLLGALGAGRSPVGMSVLKPQAIATELAMRWRSYRGEAALSQRT